MATSDSPATAAAAPASAPTPYRVEVDATETAAARSRLDTATPETDTTIGAPELDRFWSKHWLENLVGLHGIEDMAAMSGTRPDDARRMLDRLIYADDSYNGVVYTMHLHARPRQRTGEFVVSLPPTSIDFFLEFYISVPILHLQEVELLVAVPGTSAPLTVARWGPTSSRCIDGVRLDHVQPDDWGPSTFHFLGEYWHDDGDRRGRGRVPWPAFLYPHVPLLVRFVCVEKVRPYFGEAIVSVRGVVLREEHLRLDSPIACNFRSNADYISTFQGDRPPHGAQKFIVVPPSQWAQYLGAEKARSMLGDDGKTPTKAYERRLVLACTHDSRAWIL